MGSYIQTEFENVFISKYALLPLYDSLCALNDHDDLKGGGVARYSRTPRPEGLDHHPDLWYAGMLPDYPNHHSTAVEILQAIGFEVTLDEDGNIVGLWYDQKHGDEAVFLFGCAPYMRHKSVITHVHEDMSRTRYIFENGKMLIQYGEPDVRWFDEHPYSPWNYARLQEGVS